MTCSLYLPIDEVTGKNVDLDRAADFLELAAFFSKNSMAMTSDLANEVSIGAENEASIGAEEDHVDLDAEMKYGEEDLVAGAVNRIKERRRTLDASYPFELDSGGDILSFVAVDGSFGRAAYILCLVLSNLESMSSVLIGSDVHPDDTETQELRKYFQYFATAALAAEIHGQAWSFGFPRPDRSSFIPKLTEIWEDFHDGIVEAQTGAPSNPKDDKIDVFAARLHQDQLPGFLAAVAQVATGKDMKEKSLKGHWGAFKKRWFGRPPATEFLIYMIVPFAIQHDQFIDEVRTLGNVLHRLRVPRLVSKAQEVVSKAKEPDKADVQIEGYDRLTGAVQWLTKYRERSMT